MTSTFFDLRSQLFFYKWYHHNTVNVLIHCVCVPQILFTGMVLLWDIPVFGYNLTSVLSVFFCAFYIALDIPAGLLASTAIIAGNTVLYKGIIHPSMYSASLQFGVNWIMQFIGHGVFEKKKPALFDNLIQSFVLAPYFVMFEGLFFLGLYKNLRTQLNADVLEKEKLELASPSTRKSASI